jgi:hypothetical protein
MTDSVNCLEPTRISGAAVADGANRPVSNSINKGLIRIVECHAVS